MNFIIFLQVISFEPVFEKIKDLTLEGLITNLRTFLSWLALFVAGLMIVIAAYYILLSAGKEEKVRKGKRIILWVLIGLLLIIIFGGLTPNPSPPPSPPPVGGGPCGCLCTSCAPGTVSPCP